MTSFLWSCDGICHPSLRPLDVKSRKATNCSLVKVMKLVPNDVQLAFFSASFSAPILLRPLVLKLM